MSAPPIIHRDAAGEAPAESGKGGGVGAGGSTGVVGVAVTLGSALLVRFGPVGWGGGTNGSSRAINGFGSTVTSSTEYQFSLILDTRTGTVCSA